MIFNLLCQDEIQRTDGSLCRITKQQLKTSINTNTEYNSGTNITIDASNNNVNLDSTLTSVSSVTSTSVKCEALHVVNSDDPTQSNVGIKFESFGTTDTTSSIIFNELESQLYGFILKYDAPADIFRIISNSSLYYNRIILQH